MTTVEIPDAIRLRLEALHARENSNRSSGVAPSTDAPLTSGERMARLRQRDRETGRNRDAEYEQRRAPRIRDNTYRPTRSTFLSGSFIAIDGEGVSEGPIERTAIDISRRAREDGDKEAYESQPHYMILLAASTGDKITCDKGRLGTFRCLDFLLHVQQTNPKGILVCYGGSYDVNQMLLYGLSKTALRELGQGNKIVLSYQGHAYKLEYRARKCLNIWRFSGAQVNEGEKAEIHCTLWDTIGFFQSSFVTTMEKWLGKQHPDYLFIQEWKAKRGEFDRSMLADMIVYNDAECRALVAIMDKLRFAIQKLGLVLNRWDGAGAIAAAMNKKHEVKLAKSKAPEDVFQAARRAFSGGHIEVCRFGTFMQRIHHYDVNSAYPAIIRQLPDLTKGKWIHGTDFDPPAGFTLIRVRFDFPKDQPFYPLFFRCDDGTIIYPQTGEGWYWWPEYSAARQYYIETRPRHYERRDFTVLEWWHFEGATDARPFNFVEEYYQQRQEMVRLDKAGLLTDDTRWMEGAEKVIKLGINSLYGKMAQQIGGMMDEPPPYFQIEWAGFVTSGCRAMLMEAAIQKPKSIISFATDGLFSTEPLNLYCPKAKELGAWEYKMHDGGMVVAMPGVYWIFEEGEIIGITKPKVGNAMSRGFDKEAVETPELVLQKWAEGKLRVDIPMHRLVTIGTACGPAPNEGKPENLEAKLWRLRGRFIRGTRTLDISGGSVKRCAPLGAARLELHRNSVHTPPKANWRYLDWLLEGRAPDDIRSCSAPYAIAWLDDNVYEREEYDAGVIQTGEELDANENMWS